MDYYFHKWALLALSSLFVTYWFILKRESSRNLLLLLFSFTLLFSLHPLFSLLTLLLVSLTHYQTQYAREKKGLLMLLPALMLWVFALGKYGGEIFTLLELSSSKLSALLIFPLGLSYFVFRWISYMLDSQRGVLPKYRYQECLLYFFFFPAFPAGPLEPHLSFFQNRTSTLSFSSLEQAAQRIVLGYFKKWVLLELVFHAFFGKFTLGFLSAGSLPGDLTSLECLKFVSLMFIHAYLDLSAYTDLAIGTALLFGFRLCENFNAPFLQPNLAAFWRSWHMSLSNWCRDQVYFPLLIKTRRPELAIIACMMVMGLWHYLNLNWFFWGLYHGIALVFLVHLKSLRKSFLYLDRGLQSLWGRGLSHAFTLYYVACGYALVSIQDTPKALQVFFRCWGVVY